MAEIKFSGLEAFKKDLDRLDFRDRITVLIKAAVKSVEPIQEDASKNAPVGKTGNLSREIRIVEDKKASDLQSVTVHVGASSKAFYGFFQEYGTAFHPAQPFLGPAVDSNQAEVEAELVSNIEAEIARALAG